MRIEMIENAGKYPIPFTTGLLLGIVEEMENREEAPVVIRDLHQRYGHIQEVNTQNFCLKDGTSMAGCFSVDPEATTIRHALANLGYISCFSWLSLD